MRGQGVSLPEFVIVDGLITVEPIRLPSWLIRCRESDKSLTTKYRWVATLAQTFPGECEVKGYLARQEYEMTGSEMKSLIRIAKKLEFKIGRYERVDENGESRKVIEIHQSGERVIR